MPVHSLTFGQGENAPDLSPDGQWDLYKSLGEQRNTIWRVSINGGTPTQLTRDCLTLAPVISPDGARFVALYRADEADKWKIALFPIEGGAQPRQIFDFPDPYHQTIRWSPAGDALIYVDTRAGVGNLWRYALADGSRAQLTAFTEDRIYSLAWLDEKQLAIARGDDDYRQPVILENF